MFFIISVLTFEEAKEKKFSEETSSQNVENVHKVISKGPFLETTHDNTFTEKPGEFTDSQKRLHCFCLKRHRREGQEQNWNTRELFVYYSGARISKQSCVIKDLSYSAFLSLFFSLLDYLVFR